MDLPTSATLLARLRNRKDKAAWDCFVGLYTPFLFGFVRRLRFQDSDAPDLVQEVFLVLWSKLPDFRYDPSKSFRGWLRTVVWTKAHEEWRRRKPTPGPIPELPVESELEKMWDDEYDLHIWAQAIVIVKREVSEHHWKAFWECYAEGHPAAEVAAKYDMTPNALYRSAYSIRCRLKEECARLRGLLE